MNIHHARILGSARSLSRPHGSFSSKALQGNVIYGLAARGQRSISRYLKKTLKQSSKSADPGTKPGKNGTNQNESLGGPRVRSEKRIVTDAEIDLKLSIQLAKLKKEILQPDALGRLGSDVKDLKQQWRTFSRKFDLEQKRHKQPDEVIDRIRENFKAKPLQSILYRDVRNAFLQHILSTRFNVRDEYAQQLLLDCKYPTEWYPSARRIQRVLHLHIGPTNSGKTYQALKKLEQAETGVYAGPLRLLAHEVYERLNAKGNACALVTGDDRRSTQIDESAPGPLGPSKLSCTVEMAPLTRVFDVAVIDEIQMLADKQRGWAWTQALLGLNAKELHVCGEERVLHIVKVIAALCGDELHVHRYKRLSPLSMMRKSLEGDIGQLQKRDCIVGFSIVVLHAMRQLIEKRLKKKCAVVYGGLPAETRAQQAKLFNDPDNDYDFLVASNAIGMGLNLNIGRLIFQSSARIAFGKILPLEIHEVKQIAGRAGRFSTAAADVSAAQSTTATGSNSQTPTDEEIRAKGGLVTTLEKFDYKRIANAMDSEPEPITSAGMLPPDIFITRFAKHYPAGTPFSFILTRVSNVAKASDRFFICNMETQISIAEVIDSINGLTIPDRITFCASPADSKKPKEREFTRALAQKVADYQECTVLDFPELNLELLEDDYKADRAYLHALEELNKLLVIFAWVSYRFVGIFQQIELAQHVRHLVELRINETLSKLSFDYEEIRKKQERAEALSTENEDAPEDDQTDSEQLEGGSAEEASSPYGDESANRIDDSGSGNMEGDIMSRLPQPISHPQHFSDTEIPRPPAAIDAG